MAHTILNKKPLLNRIRRIKGQTAALEEALNNEVECIAILQQVAAIRGAVNGLMTEVLEGHIREHLTRDQSDLETVLKVIRSYLK